MEPLENIYFPEYNEDPFACDYFPEGFEILRDYLEPVKKEKKKKFFFGKKEDRGEKARWKSRCCMMNWSIVKLNLTYQKINKGRI